MSASMTISPSVATCHNKLTITATNTGTGVWTRFTGFTISGNSTTSIVPNTTSVSYTTTPQVATFQVDPGITPASLTITNTTDSSTATLVSNLGPVLGPEAYPLPGTSISEVSVLEDHEFTVRPGNIVMSNG